VQSVDASGNPLAPPFNPTSTGGTALRTVGGQFVFNWQTSGVSAGYYQILLSLNDGTLKTKQLQLTATMGSGATIVNSNAAVADLAQGFQAERFFSMPNANPDTSGAMPFQAAERASSLDAPLALAMESKPARLDDLLLPDHRDSDVDWLTNWWEIQL
jgi:hypothetical protein